MDLIDKTGRIRKKQRSRNQIVVTDHLPINDAQVSFDSEADKYI